LAGGTEKIGTDLATLNGLTKMPSGRRASNRKTVLD
jgi:hypothetical protein